MSEFSEQFSTPPARPNIVLVGGGNGTSVMAAGIAEHWPEADVTAIVATSDSGGSTGRLREQFGTPPVGDIRRVTSALSQYPELAEHFEARLSQDATPETVAAQGSVLLEHLFDRQDISPQEWSSAAWAVERTTALAGQLESLRGHTFGNLLMTSLVTQGPEEDPSLTKAAETVGRWLGARGRVLPVTEVQHDLVMHDGGEVLVGEHVIDEHIVHDPRSATVRLEAARDGEVVTATPEARTALINADMVILGPGSVFTSIQAATAAEGVAEALQFSQERGGTLVAIGNLVVGADTHGMQVGDIFRKLQESLGRNFTHVVYNTDTQALPRGQALEFGPDSPEDPWRALGLPLAEAGTVAVDPNDAVIRSAVRHDTQGVARVLREEIHSSQAALALSR